jgi:hypothetical protein
MQKLIMPSKTLLALTALVVAPIWARTAHAIDYQTRARFSAEVSKLICSDGGAWFEKCYGIKASTCMDTAAGFVNPCVESRLGQIQQPLDEAAGMETAKKLVACFNETFVTFYASTKSSDPSCNTPPSHLQR